jgi:triacylglycerol lipase
MDETLATLREAVLWPRDLATILPTAGPGDDVVVLIHGFLASGGVFRPMRRWLEREANARVATFTHAPGFGVRSIARSLARIVAKIPREARVHVVGHSLGGLVARWYVQELGGHARIAQTISLASPFGGTPVAEAFPWLVGADLLPDSPLLDRLRTGPYASSVPHLSIVAGKDRLVPARYASFHHGDVVHMPGRGHNTLLFDEEVIRLIADRVRAVARDLPRSA